MGFFSELGAGFCERKRAVAGIFVAAGIAMASFLIGTWAASSGVFTLRPPKISGSHSNDVLAPGSHTAADKLQFSAKTLDGQEFQGASLLGKPAVLWFWAPWCVSCQREASTVAKSAAANPAVTFVGVAAGAPVSAMREFVDKYQLNGFTQLADVDAKVWAKFGVTEQPAYAFISSGGDVDVVKGVLPRAQLAQRLDALAR
jgi:thiol-disulfide isomerase/thioredoxin